MKIKKGEIERDIMTEFEYDCLWMSIRYAIGRHTISSHSHAGEIVRNCYGRFISEERQEYEAYDICREIDDVLRWHFNFYISEHELDNREQFQPLDLFLNFITTYGITDINDFKKIKAIYVKYDKSTKEFSFDVREMPNGEDSKSCYSLMDIDDLIIWQLASHCLNRCCHKKAILIDDTECEMFDGWTNDRTNPNVQLSYKKIHIPVDSFRVNSSVITYIPDENIKEIVEYNYLPYSI